VSPSALTPIDLATGIVLGAPSRPSALQGAAPDPAAALEAVVLPALRRGPCFVSFSGGRDSSAVLAFATAVARRHGLPDPLPITNVVEGAEDADESEWQEAVVAHLGLADWVRLRWDDELDAVGPIAQRVLARHGLLWPCNTHFHLPLLEAAAGGSFLTGVGGDELFLATCAEVRRGAAHRRAAMAAFERAPAALRRPVLRRRRPLHLPWLTAEGRRLATATAAAHVAAEPAALAPRLAWARAQRYLGVATDALGRLAADADVAIAHPLLEPRVWSAIGATLGRRRFADRTEGMRALFGDLLPPRVLARTDKAGFDSVFCGPHARAVAAGYAGEGAPPELVDAAALRAHWERGEPRPQSLLLLQAAWLAGRDRLQQRAGGVGEALPDLRPAQVQHGE
jgi:asparagine synthase (glutamine-hydrolysing)